MDHLCYLCLVFVMLSRLFIAALWSPERNGLSSWPLFVMFVTLLLSYLVRLRQVWYLIVQIPDPCCLSYFAMLLVCSLDISERHFILSTHCVELCEKYSNLSKLHPMLSVCHVMYLIWVKIEQQDEHL